MKHLTADPGYWAPSSPSLFRLQGVPPQDGASHAGPPLPEPGERPAVGAQSGLILLVEDDFILRGALAELLQAEGYRVECAANGLDALRRLEHAPKPALILLDIMLPYVDGLEFRAIQRASSAIADIPIIVITAVGIRPEVARDLDLRQAFFKPLDQPRLLAAIRRHCAPSVC
jgi:CheY-like chemotaxis protein